jgi:hypothetical protein
MSLNRIEAIMMRFRHFLQRFRKDERGTVAVEFMIVLPLLIWCFAGMHIYFMAYRTQTVNVKSAYTIGDQISRETGYVTPAYMDAMFSLHRFLMNTTSPTAVRVTAFEYERDDDSYRVIWSEGRGRPDRLTDARILDVRNQLPIMPDEEIAILTETWVDFVSDPIAGLGPFTSAELVITRPRFAGQICWNSLNNGTQTTAVCQAGF